MTWKLLIKSLMKSEEASHRRTSTAMLHLSVVLRVIKFIDSEMEGDLFWRLLGIGSCLTDSKVHFG